MAVKIQNIVARENVEGREKPYWNPVGVLITTDKGAQYVKLYHLPGKFYVFDRNDQDRKPATVPDQDIPF